MGSSSGGATALGPPLLTRGVLNWPSRHDCGRHVIDMLSRESPAAAHAEWLRPLVMVFRANSDPHGHPLGWGLLRLSPRTDPETSGGDAIWSDTQPQVAVNQVHLTSRLCLSLALPSILSSGLSSLA